MAFVFCSAVSEDTDLVSRIAQNLGFPVTRESEIAFAADMALALPKFSGLFLGPAKISLLRQHKSMLALVDRNKIHIIVDPDNRELVEYIFRERIAGNVIFRRFDDFDTAAKQYSRVLKNALAKKGPGLQNFFPGSSIKTTELRQFSDKQFLTEKVSSYLRSIDCSERVAQNVASAADELLLNSIVHLKMASEHDHKSAEVVLKKHPVCIQLGSEGDSIAVGVTAVQKSTETDVIFDSLARAYASSENGRAADNQGFALGLALILRSGASLWFSSHQGSYLEVAILFKKSQKILDFRNQFQFIATVIVEKKI
jgi:hypothetical protein